MIRMIVFWRFQYPQAGRERTLHQTRKSQAQMRYGEDMRFVLCINQVIGKANGWDAIG
jgi:hypothetical protein